MRWAQRSGIRHRNGQTARGAAGAGRLAPIRSTQPPCRSRRIARRWPDEDHSAIAITRPLRSLRMRRSAAARRSVTTDRRRTESAAILLRAGRAAAAVLAMDAERQSAQRCQSRASILPVSIRSVSANSTTPSAIRGTITMSAKNSLRRRREADMPVTDVSPSPQASFCPLRTRLFGALQRRYHESAYGAIAQLEERLDRTQEAAGSSPASSIQRTPM